MTQLKIHFAYPLLLLVFLFGAALTAFLYFRLSKKYRRNRNRITSNVLHLIVFLLAVLTLAGTVFSFEKPNTDNQILLLVDMSDTEDQSAEDRDAFVETVLSMGQYDGYRMGVVTFGYDQVYAVPMTSEVNVDNMITAYKGAEKPDTTATDIAAALSYAATLFDKPESAKIVLITDGKQTDEDASSVIRTIAAKGIKVDVANIPSETFGNDFCLSDVTLPDYHLSVEEEFPISVTLYARSEQTATLSLYDNGALVETQTVSTVVGTQNISFRHTMGEYGLHEFSFKLALSGDEREENNTYRSFLYLEQFNNILILEQQDGESDQLKTLLTEGSAGYKLTVMNILYDENVPKTLAALRQYDQVILCNIANKDMPEGFADLLYQYVNECGGGVFTVGGTNADGTAHAYNRADMANSIYQSLLPVQAINYKPPIAVMIIVDRSGSMTSTDEYGSTKYDLAVNGAGACLNALDDRDYIGLMSLDSTYDTLLPLTACTQKEKIKQAFTDALELGTGGGTVFPAPIEKACLALREIDVAKRHIIIVSDGAVSNEEEIALYEQYVKEFHETDGITFSFVGIGISTTDKVKMERLCELGGGRMYATTSSDTIRVMREDLKVPEITEVQYETFYPTVKNPMSPLFHGIDLTVPDSSSLSMKMKVSLDGYYGVKKKSAADAVLVGEYEIPIYAQWKVGKGAVGSFMCDLNGSWSADFLNLNNSNDGSGRQFILNAISGLMPTESIRENEITVTFQSDNYTDKIGVITHLEEGQTIKGLITGMSDGSTVLLSMNEVTPVPDNGRLTDLAAYVTSALDLSNNYSRCAFVIKEGGVYKIELQKLDADGKVLATYETYHAFSYSEEYDLLAEYPVTVGETDLLTFLATHGGGAVIADNEDPQEIFANFVTRIVNNFDPRILFMILILVLFLTDIAVRKFKFKWPHEIIRNLRGKKN